MILLVEFIEVHMQFSICHHFMGVFLGGTPLSEERIQACIVKAIKHGVQIRKLYTAVLQS